MRTIETTVFTFDELSDEAKEKAREWFRQHVFTDSHDWEPDEDDAATCADLLGINLRQCAVKLLGGGTRYEPAIWFSGFWSQGDGACFEGVWYGRDAAEASTKIRAHAPRDTRLHAIADALTGIEHLAGYSARMEHTGYYYHSGCMSVEVKFDDSILEDTKVEPECDQLGNRMDGLAEGALPQANFSAAEETITGAMRDFADWIYRQLETEYEYQSSNEVVDDNIRANEYEFEEDGTRA